MSYILEVSLTNTIVATLLALVAAAVGRFLRRPALAHTLWLLVLLKLLTPPLFRVPVAIPESANSLFAVIFQWPLAADRSDSLFSQEAPSQEDTEDDADDEIATLTSAPCSTCELRPPGSGLAGPSEAAVLHESERLAQSGASSLPSRRDRSLAVAAQTEPGLLVDGGQWLEGVELAWDWIASLSLNVLFFLWAAGAASIFVVAGLRIACFHRLLRYAQPASAEVNERVRRLAEQLGLYWCPEVLTVPGPVSPLVWCLGRQARLVLPERLMERLQPQQQDTLLAHELAHICRHDHWVRWLEVVACGLFWWHPVAWWARRQLQSLEEQCCDAWVVWALPSAARAYARALLETVDFLSEARPALPPAASGLGYVHHLKRRLRMILREPHYHRLSWPAVIAVVLVGMLILPLGPVRLAAETPATPSDALVTANPPDDEDGPQAGDMDDEDDDGPQTRDLDRRLRKLENQMERVLRALESQRSGREAGRATEPPSDEAKRRDEEAKQRAQEAKERARELERQARERARQLAEQARERAREMEQRAREMARQARERAREAAKDDGVKKSDGDRSVDKDKQKEELKRMIKNAKESAKEAASPERIKELQRQIESAVREAVNPERMKEMERRIEEAVSQSVNPERMKAMQKQIDEAVRRAVDPKRMEAMAKQIEEAVNRSLRAQERDEARRRERSESTPRPTPAPKVTATPPAPPTAPIAPRAARGPRGRDSRDLEDRLNKLEEKMDRLLERLESSRK
jgi:beta-lactamase regulating signal transducer with metallopeptidase domain